MTINSTDITSGPYTGNGITTVFSYTFKINTKDQLTVYEFDTDGNVSELTLEDDYEVYGMGTDGGGVIERLAGALPTGYKWYIRSDYVETQEVNFSSQGGFFPDVHEGALDKLTILTQQLSDRIRRSLKFNDWSIEADSTNVIVPDPEALKFMRWKADESGLENVELTAIDPDVVEISDYLKIVDGVRNFATVAAAVTAASSLASGQEVSTRGYYAANDGGGANYIVVTTASVTPVTYVDHDLGGGLNLYFKNRDIIHVKQAGVLQNDATKSANFRAAVSVGKIIYALDAAYTLDYYAAITGVDLCLRITAGKTFIMGGSTVISSTTSTETRAAVIGVWRDDDNVTIIGGHLVGDRSTYAGATSESRHGLWVGEADNLNVYGTKVTDCHGDGYYISGWPNNPTVAPSTRIYLHNVVAENNYRNNMSLTFVDGFDISATLKNANGTSPEAGLDIEPNANQYVKNGKIHVTSEDNDVDGILIYGEATSTEISDVTITGISRNNGGAGLGMSGLSGFNVNDLTVDITTHGNTGNGAKFLYLKDSKLSIQSYSNSITTQGDIRLNGCDGVSLHDWSSVSTTAVAALEIRDSDRITASNNLRSDCRSGVTVATIYVYSGSTEITLEGVNVTGSNTIGINADSSTFRVNILGGTVSDCSLTTTATSNAINIRSEKGTVNGVSIDQPGTANTTNYGISMGSYICATGNLISGYTTAYQSVGAGNVYSGLNVTVP